MLTKTILRYSDLYIEYAKQNFKVMLEYRADFFIGALSTFFLQLGSIAFVWIIFNNIKDLNGWSFYEVAFIFALTTIAKSINHIFFDNFWVLGWHYIRTGNFDIILTRPVSPLFQLIANKIQQDGFGNLIIGLIIFFKCIIELNLNFTYIDIFLLIVFIISGGMIFAAINFITCTSSFWIIHSHTLISSVFTFHEFALYPLTIFKKSVIILLTWVIPYAFSSFYPSNYFLNKGFKELSYLTPVIAIVLWCIGMQFWKSGLKNYTGTGS
ncbi:ABC-2 family transporter protein [Candidatus Dependentiae bacterium]|nr:ABC-2 family transporter protein [Candidatus Dependentiae bacterium]